METTIFGEARVKIKKSSLAIYEFNNIIFVFIYIIIYLNTYYKYIIN